MLDYSFKSPPFVNQVLLPDVLWCVVSTRFLTFTYSPSSSPSCFWPGLSLLHSHCIQQILESVNHCHINGIVHRDLKVSK